MPATSIRDLVIKDDDLVVGTHGRSFWILDDITPLRQMGTPPREAGAPKRWLSLDVSSTSDVHLFAPQAAWRVRWNMNTDTPLPPEEPAGENPPDGAIINYYLKSKSAGPVMLEINDGAGSLVRRYATDDPVEPLKDEGNVPAYWIRPTLVLSNDAGMHRFVWDLHYTRPEGMAASFPIAATYRNTARSPQVRGPIPGDIP